MRQLRWVPAAVLAACCGVLLAVWTHDGELTDAGGEASPPASAPSPSPSAQAPAPRPDSREGAVTAAPASAVEAADAEDAPERLDILRKRLLERAGTDVDGALQALLALDGQNRSYLAEDVIISAAQAAPQRTVAWLHANVSDPAKRERLLAAAYAGVAQSDPAFAMSAAQGLTDPELRRTAAHQVLEAWAGEDPVAAYEWVRTHSGPDAADLHVTVMNAYVEALPGQAGDLIAALPAGELQGRLVNEYAGSIAATDPGRALGWLEQFDHGIATGDAVLTVVNQWAQREPWEAISYATERMDGEASFQAVAQIAVELGSSRPNVVADSLGRLPEAYRTMTAELLAGSWAAEQPAQAEAWMASLEPGPVQDAAIRGLAQVAMRESPEQAQKLARAVSVPEVRQSLLRDIETQRQAGTPASDG